MHPDREPGRGRRAHALAATLLALLTSATRVARADDNSNATATIDPASVVTAVTLHHDGPGSRPEREPLARFGVTGEPLAYVDWLCLQTDRDVGPALVLDPAAVSAVDDDGRAVGAFVSASGRAHEFRAWHYADGAGQHFRYCSKVLPREYRRDAVRFAPAPGAPATYEHLSLALRGDVRGCAGRACGELHPALASFAYGLSAMRYAHVDALRWQGGEITGAGLGPGAARLRVTAFIPVWTTALTSPHGLQPDVETGLAIPVTLAREDGAGASAGAGVGVGAGLYWAQCVNLRGPVTPRICAGLEIDVSFERGAQAGAGDGFGPRVLGGWYVSIGAGEH